MARGHTARLIPVGWHPDSSIVVLQRDTILLVDTTDGSATPIGPASVNDLSFDVWGPPTT